MGLKTIVLKLYKPGKGKRYIIDTALSSYNAAYRLLLEKAYEHLNERPDEFSGEGGRGKVSALSKSIVRELKDKLNQYGVQPFKDSLEMDLAMTLAGYFRLKAVKPEAGFPLLKNREGAKEEKLRPIYFCRYDIKRNYCILYDSARDKYYAKLHLMNSRNARTVEEQGGKGQNLIYIHKSLGVVERGKKKETFIVVPLSFGKYQEEVLRAAMEKPEVLRTAKLGVKGHEYFLTISIDTGEAEKVNTDTFMGVSRGLKNSLAYTVVDSNGEAVNSGVISQDKVNFSKDEIPMDQLHKSANRIVCIAKEYKSKVIFENFLQKGDRLIWTDDGYISQPVYKNSDYTKLVKLLEYKLPEAGLPPPVKVSPVDIFYRCHACGFHSRKNRFSRDTFICTRCGATLEIERLGSLNLSRKLIDYSNSKIKIKVTNTSEGVWFTNSFIGLDYFVPYNQNQFEKLREKIQGIVDDFKKSSKDSWGKERSKKISIIKKFDYSNDFMEFIEFV